MLLMCTSPGWVPGAPLLKNHPPAPQPEEMRGGMLEKYNLQCKARKSQSGVDATIKVGDTSEAREIYHAIVNAKVGRTASSEPSVVDQVQMEVEESVPEPAPSVPMEDVHVGKGRKSNTISFTSYDDDSSDDDS